ncbi:hypothetical protein PSU4_59730 [Pseudonocardia sulfidoxydans NBRC 16205]|uniref:Uncharacterized protein n=1 Tax=Pseudonocardia sulfidoxydans NBRC 16205 TaxID=1223511 RepID=A0A511DQF3_9PSEU|nr:hypothetical protein [Pseudonocardia sulfidoxydans]GEL27019.1 hypothetical protein PSU4_59730 [Pseudonocardia sulfidoxydans NBRC 16205]
MIEWSDLVTRFRTGDELKPLVGGSALTIESVDEEQICIRQRLWRACVTRADMKVAGEILDAAPADISPVELAERIRVHYMSGFELVTECSRVPNLAAILLYNAGAVSS